MPALLSDGQSVVPTPLISDRQNVTNSWENLGVNIDTWKYRYLALFLEIDINDTQDFRIRIIAKKSFTDTLEYVFPINTIGASFAIIEDEYIEFNNDSNQNIVIIFDLYKLIPVIQIQIMAGTVGLSPGQIDSVFYILSM